MNALQRSAVALGILGVGAWLLSRRRPDFDFRGKVVLLTGGSRGLGLVLARQLIREGAKLAICARDEEELDRAGAELAVKDGWPLTLPCDVTFPEQVVDLVRAVEVHLGPVDVLINNAGIIEVGPLRTMTRGDFEEALAVNFWGAYNAVEAVLSGMRRRRHGRIVNVSSVGGKVSIPHLLPYSASKFALAGYSQGLRAELANDGIAVTTVFPGLIRTGSPRHAWFKGQNRAEYAWFSVSDALPLLTISAERAASQILDACRRGQAEAVLSLPAKVAVKLHALFPELTADVLSLVNRLLPRSQGAGPEAHEGKDSESWASPSVLTTLGDRAAVRNNEFAPSEV
jgi:NAD(P)-dependent dehydrogenase (short-subunit alcohol dehydrogenase family)